MLDVCCSEAVRDVYIYEQKQRPVDGDETASPGSRSQLRRSHSFSGTSNALASQFSVPGGFRRQFLLNNKNSRRSAVRAEEGSSASAVSSAGASDSSRTPSAGGESQSRSFLATFLRAYEDSRLLKDISAMSEEDFFMLSPDVSLHSGSALLLPRQVAERRADAIPLLDGHSRGDLANPSPVLAGTSRTVFNIVKSFLGTAILFIPRGVRSAGLVAGVATLMLMAGLSTWAMVLLLRTRKHLEITGNGGRGRTIFGYGHVARLTLGRYGQYAVETAILLSQIGFCCVYFSFWGAMLSEVLIDTTRANSTASGGGADVLAGWESSRLALGSICLVLSVPLVWIRHLKYLAVGNFLSDIAIAFSLGYIVWAAGTALGARRDAQDWSCLTDAPDGGNGSSVCFWINPSSFLMFAGTSVYSFEGIAMVIPIQSSMERPQDMVRLLSLSMLGMSLLLAGFGAFCFYAFGGETANIIISNLPRGQPLTRATQIAYLFVAVFTVPMCLFPAIRIWERWVFKKQRRSGKKWQKNFLRAAAAVGCLFVGVYGGGELDHLVSLIGGLFSTPLALVFPPLLHLASRADTRPCARAIDAALVGFGVSAGLLATWVAIKSW
eukprot:g4876.t1